MTGNTNINLLECTLRDGGQGLEIANKEHLSDIVFGDERLRACIRHLVQADIDIVELGYIDNNEFEGHPFSNFYNVEEISKFIPTNKNPRQLYVGLFTGPDVNLNDIPNWNESLVDGLRVILRYSQLEKSLEFCEGLTKKGYKTFIQPMLTMRYSDSELEMVIDRANSMKAYALYFVDSFGYMQSDDVERLFYFFNERLSPEIYLGFHAHNNLNLAFSNALKFLDIAFDRKVIIDSTSTGMGQGAGNLQTELILPYLNRQFGKNYNYDELLEVCDLIEPMTSNPQWGYSVSWALPAVYNTAYKYSMVMRKIMGFSYSKINYVLQNIPSSMRHRYTRENLDYVLQKLSIDEA